MWVLRGCSHRFGEEVRVVAGLSRVTKSFVTEKENFCRDDNRNFAPRDDMRP